LDKDSYLILARVLKGLINDPVLRAQLGDSGVEWMLRVIQVYDSPEYKEYMELMSKPKAKPKLKVLKGGNKPTHKEHKANLRLIKGNKDVDV